MGILKQGKIIVFTGNGKGKTTAAVGRGLMALSEGHAVKMVQFLKGTGYTGELFAQKRLGEKFQIQQFGTLCWQTDQIAAGEAWCNQCGSCFRGNRNPENGFALAAFAEARRLAIMADVSVLILDEISHSINKKMIDLPEFTKWLKDRRADLTVVLTGRNMPQELIDIADEANELLPLKHPMEKGTRARWGIEY